MRKIKLIALFINFALLLGYMPGHLIDNSLWAAAYQRHDAEYSGVIFPGDVVQQHNLYIKRPGIFQLTYKDGENILYQIPEYYEGDYRDPMLPVLSVKEAHLTATTPSVITVKLQEEAFLAWNHSSSRGVDNLNIGVNITRTLDALYLEPKLQNISLKKTDGLYDDGTYTLYSNMNTINSDDDNVTYTLTVDKGYLLPESVTVTMENNASPEYTYNVTTGTISFKRKDIKGNVTLKASGVPILASTQVTYQGNNTIKCEGTVTNSPYAEAGFVIKDESKQEVNRVLAITNPALVTAPFETQIAHLTTGSTYYVYVYLVNPTGAEPYTIQGSEQQFIVPRDFYISEARSIGTANASVEGQIEYHNYTEAGFALMNAAGTLIKYVPCTTEKGLFSYVFTGLERNTTYTVGLYYKASTTGDLVVVNEPSISFTTLEREPEFKLNSAKNITETSATIEGTIIRPGATEVGIKVVESNNDVPQYIVCNPTLEGNFTYVLTQLKADKQYTVYIYYKEANASQPVVIEPAKITFKTNASSSPGSTGNTGSTGGSSSSGGSSSTNTVTESTAHKKQTETTNASETIITIGKDGVAQVSSESLKETVKAEKQLIITNERTSLSFNKEALNELLSNGTDDLKVALAPTEAKKLENIYANANEQGQLTPLNNASLWFNLETSTGDKVAPKFNEPLKVIMSLEGIQIKDPSKLCLVKYQTDAQGNVTFTKLGGTYDPETKTFPAYINEAGSYGIVEAKELTKIKLSIGKNQIKLNGKEAASNAAPRIINGETVLPLRTIAETLGAEVKWNNKNKEAVITLGGKTVIVGAKEGAVNDNGRILVPLRYISENLGAHVLWIPSTKEIEIVK